MCILMHESYRFPKNHEFDLHDSVTVPSLIKSTVEIHSFKNSILKYVYWSTLRV